MKNEKQFCFIIMPFDEEYTTVYENCLKPLVKKKLGMECIRIDEWPSCKKTIIDNIKTKISQCLFAIADLSKDKPNVYYEIGLAHAFGKDVIFIKNKQLGNIKLPFDISPWHAFAYDRDVLSYETLFKKILQMIQRDFPEQIKQRHKKIKGETVSPKTITGKWKGEYKIEKDGRPITHEVELTIIPKGRIYEAFCKIEIDHNIKLTQFLEYHYKLNGDEWVDGNWIELIGSVWGNNSECLKDYWMDVYAIDKNTDGETLHVKIWDNVNTKKKDVLFERI